MTEDLRERQKKVQMFFRFFYYAMLSLECNMLGSEQYTE